MKTFQPGSRNNCKEGEKGKSQIMLFLQAKQKKRRQHMLRRKFYGTLKFIVDDDDDNDESNFIQF